MVSRSEEREASVVEASSVPGGAAWARSRCAYCSLQRTLNPKVIRPRPSRFSGMGMFRVYGFGTLGSSPGAWERAWEPLGAAGKLWDPLAAPGSPWEPPAAPESLWELLGGSGSPWQLLGAPGSFRPPESQGRPETTRDNLGSPNQRHGELS